MRDRTEKLGAGDPDATQPDLTFRTLEEMVELVECEAIQREVWGLDDRDIVPASHLRAAAHAGGQVVGAFAAAELLGFAYAFVATPHGRGMAGVGLHSHMLAVRSHGRGRGLGRSLKLLQRSLALEQGLNWMTWTFDPLQARNANLNLRHLGAVCNDYLVDFYGAMPGTLGGGQASDRLLALWLLDDPEVASLAEAFAAGGEGAAAPARADTVRELWLLTLDDVLGRATRNAHELFDATSERARAALSATSIESPHDPAVTVARIAAPTDVTSLLSHDPELANLWRLGMRAAMTEALAAGLTVTGFDNGAYTLRRTD